MEERVYVIPLRKSFRKVPDYKRTKKAVREIGYFISKHMKSDNVKIAIELSNLMHKHGRKNPPARIKVKAVKDVKKDKHKKDVEFVMVHSFDYKEKLSLEKKPSGKKEEKAEVKATPKEEAKIVAKPESKTIEAEVVKEASGKTKEEKPKAKKVVKKEA